MEQMEYTIKDDTIRVKRMVNGEVIFEGTSEEYETAYGVSIEEEFFKMLENFSSIDDSEEKEEGNHWGCLLALIIPMFFWGALLAVIVLTLC